jgi:hypothetical protein
MEIHINVIGLCVLVPSADGRRMHVLFPRTGFSTPGGEHVHPHDPVLIYAGIRPHVPDMRGFAVDLSGLRVAGGTVPPLDTLLDVAGVVGGGLDPGELGGSPSQRVIGRVTLPLPDPGDVGEADPFVWRVTESTGAQVDRPLIHQISWIIRSPEEIAWQRTRLRAPRAPSEDMGQPTPDTDDVIRVFVSHLPRVKHTVCRGHKAEHAQAYYDLFGRSGSSPVLNDDSPDPLCPEGSARRRPLVAETAFNCMLGKAPST